MNATDELDTALLDAHERGDGAQLVRLYRQAADQALGAGDIQRGCFYLTHAFVFALEAGMPEAQELCLTLVKYGREE